MSNPAPRDMHRKDVPAPRETRKRFHVWRKAKFSLVPILIILTLRQLFPEMGNYLSGVYELMDNTILPLVNWGFGLINNVIEWLMSLGWFKAIIAALGSLGA